MIVTDPLHVLDVIADETYRLGTIFLSCRSVEILGVSACRLKEYHGLYICIV
jgi:hypothetical protein